jgi:hypothetical protein
MQILLSTSIDNTALSVMRVSSSFNSAIISFFSSSTTPGGANLIFRSTLDPNKQASIHYNFQSRRSPSVVSIQPSTGYIDVASIVEIELQVTQKMTNYTVGFEMINSLRLQFSRSCEVCII